MLSVCRNTLGPGWRSSILRLILAVDSLTLYTCDHVIKDFLLLSHVTPLLVCVPMCPKSRQISVYLLAVFASFMKVPGTVSLKVGLSFSISLTL